MPASFFPVARKEYLTRRHAASAQRMIRILPPSTQHLNLAPVPWGFWSGHSAYQPAAISHRRRSDSARRRRGDGYQSSTLPNATSPLSLWLNVRQSWYCRCRL